MVMNPFTRSLLKKPTGADPKTFRNTHNPGQSVKNTINRTNVSGVAHGFKARKQVGIFGSGMANAQSAQTPVKKTDLQDARTDEMNRARLSSEAADFLQKQQSRRSLDEKARQKIKIENDLNEVSQRWFMIGQKINQLKSDHRRNEMESMHTAGLTRRYNVDVDRYKSDIVKEESIINELKKELRRNPPNPRRPQTMVLAANIQKKIHMAEGNIRRIRNLSHGVEVKIKMQEESADARDQRQKGLERDINVFSKMYEELEARKHMLEQQQRYLKMKSI